MRAFWRWLNKPAISVADGLLIAATVLAADAMKLAWRMPWPVILIVVFAVTAGALFFIGFAKGFARSMLADFRHWRARP